MHLCQLHTVTSVLYPHTLSNPLTLLLTLVYYAPHISQSSLDLGEGCCLGSVLVACFIVTECRDAYAGLKLTMKTRVTLNS